MTILDRSRRGVAVELAQSQQGMRCRVVSVADLTQSDEEAWRDLAARSVEPNPFYEADFVIPSCRHLKNGKKVVLVVAEKAGHFHACLPVRQISLTRFLRPPVVTSWRHLYGYLGTPLVAPEHAVEALGCLLAALSGSAVWPRTVVLEQFGDDGPIASYLRCAAAELNLAVRVHAPGERAVLRCMDNEASVLPASVKREWRAKAKQWRRLCAALGDPAVVDHAKDPQTAADFLAMEASGWKGKARTAMSSRPGDAAFYHEVTTRFAASGRLRLYSLQAGGEALAMQTNLCADGILFDWKAAYDERFAGYGPGAQLQLQVYHLAQEDGTRWIDSCADAADDHQLRLCPDRRRIATLAIGRKGWTADRQLTIALLLVKVSGKLRGVSARTLRYRLTGIRGATRLMKASAAARKLFRR